MKKLLILLLAVIFSCGSFVSCSNEQEGAESLVESVAETSSESSVETSGEVKIPPEKVVYFTGKYKSTQEFGVTLFSDSWIINEDYSYYSGGLREYFNKNEVSDDTYFLVGVMPLQTDYADFETQQKMIKEWLEPYDFIEIEGHHMIADAEYLDKIVEYNEKGDLNEAKRLETEYIKKLLPDVDFSEIGDISQYAEMTRYIFGAVGYISAKSLREYGQNNDMEHRIIVTWFPAPDDQERWLTCGDD